MTITLQSQGVVTSICTTVSAASGHLQSKFQEKVGVAICSSILILGERCSCSQQAMAETHTQHSQRSTPENQHSPQSNCWKDQLKVLTCGSSCNLRVYGSDSPPCCENRPSNPPPSAWYWKQSMLWLGGLGGSGGRTLSLLTSEYHKSSLETTPLYCSNCLTWKLNPGCRTGIS